MRSPDNLPSDTRCVHELLSEAAQVFPAHEAVRDESGTWTYEQLVLASCAVERRLAGLGVRPGDRILCLTAGSRDFAALFYGASRRGAILVPTGEDTSSYQLRWLIEDAQPTLVVVPPRRAAALVGSGVREVTLDALVSGAPVESHESSAINPNEPALIIYTSGTTARPKGIVCPHKTVTWTAESIASRLGYRHTDVVYSRLPVSFDYGLYQILLCALSGAALIFAEDTAVVGALQVIRESGATIVPVVPTFASVLCKLARRDPLSTSVRMITNTGASLIGADAQRIRKAFPGAALVCMYGMSECKRITIADPDEDLEHPGTVGRPIPGTRVFTLDENGTACPPGEIGQIVSAGPHVMAGYWQAPKASDERFVTAPDGVGMAVFTGDYGYVDNGGRLYFVGRRDELFKRRGWRMSTQEIESAALDVPDVFAAACLPPGPEGTLTIWVQSAGSPAEVIHGLAERLGSAKTPDECIVVDHLPQTPNGKIDKNALREARLRGTSRR